MQCAIGGFPTLWVIDRKGALREPGDVEHLDAHARRVLAEPADDAGDR